MFSFKQYVNEMSFHTPIMKSSRGLESKEFSDRYDKFVEELVKWAKEANKICWKYKTEKLIWRGVKIKGGKYGVVILANNKDRESYMGKILPQVKEHIDNLKDRFHIGIPVFTIKNKNLAGLFGSAMVFLPKDNYRCLWSTNVSDSAHLKVKDLTDELYHTYHERENSLPTGDFNGEIIFDCDEYYLVDVFKLLTDTKSNKELQTYEDLAKLLYHWIQKTLFRQKQSYK